MALVNIPYGLDIPKATSFELFRRASFTNWLTASGSLVRGGISGYVCWSDGKTHNISKIHTRTGTGCVTGDVLWVVELQDVKTTGGAVPMEPDGVADQTSTGVAIPASSTWVTSTLTTVRAAPQGSLLSVVYRWSTGTTGTLTLSAPATSSGVNNNNSCCFVTSSNAGTDWAEGNTLLVPNVMFESDDATPVYGTIVSAAPVNTFNSHTMFNTSDPNELGNKFLFPFSGKVGYINAKVTASSVNASVSAKVYNDTGTLVATVALIGRGIASTRNYLQFALATPVAFTKNVAFYVTISATDAGGASVSTASYDLPNAAYFNAWPIGAGTITGITKQGATITETATRVYAVGVGVTEITDAAGGGGGGATFKTAICGTIEKGPGS